ncbi:MAG: YkgJ family cysteine cluster protein [Dehalococcoidales bacterium]|nr:YkgJ family cysteine cluster protein [Dehalococcoidales bacterium]
MEDRMREPEEIDKLDLERYGLAHLEGSNLLALTGPDMDKLLNTLGEEDISLIVPLPCTPDNIQRVLSYSECRRCGDCCIPNPLNPASPGVEVFEDEAKSIADHLHTTEEALRNMTTQGKIVPYPFQPTKLSFTRWLPLPCPFHIEEPNSCRIYPVRPIVCQVHPIIFTGDEASFAIKVNCDYGKDLVKSAFAYVRENDPELEIKL